MDYKPEPLLENCVYHIYNRGNNGINIFFDRQNYYYFLKLYKQYITPVAETYAWCLIENHFHLLVLIKDKSQIEKGSLEYSTVTYPKIIDASKQFSHFFNAYTQAINTRYGRTGSLFEKPFKRKHVTPQCLRKLIYYIHHNPVHHGLVKHPVDYAWSSYGLILSARPAIICTELILKTFGSKECFINFHLRRQNLTEIHNFILE
ncbi:MAG TPA: hypothetical protein VGB43_04315 [Flavobacterium sp.]|jgi:REP element-mobilizing transposase RayT